MKAGEIVEIMERHFPLSLQEEWDVSGFQCGHYEQEVHKIMIALDCDLRTIREAIAKGCDMLITHHPFLFKRLERIYLFIISLSIHSTDSFKLS